MPDETRAHAASLMRAAVRRLAGEYPLHGSILSRARWRPSADTIKLTLAIDTTGFVIEYAPTYIASMNVDRCTGLLVHVINHVLFGHLAMTPEAFPDESALIIAQEVTANEWVAHELLPPNSTTLGMFPDLPLGEDTITRYERLRGRELDPSLTADDHTAGVHGRSDLTEAMARGGVIDALATLTPGERSRVPASLMDSVRDLVGTSTSGTVESIDTTASAGLRWKRILRLFAASEPSPTLSLSWPSRRLPALIGVVPGVRRAPGRPRVMAVIDTSGSLSTELLSAIHGELRAMAGTAEVVIVQCDTEIHSVAPFDQRVREVQGRGGTDLRPPFERRLLRRVRPDAIVYFTDGEGPAPDRPPAERVLWCLTPHGRRPAFWGRALWMRP